MESLLLRCQYVILPGKLKHECQYRDLYNDAYAFWKEYWQRMFKAKAPGFWNPLDFFRQDLVYCLFYDGKIAAQNLSMFAHADDLITPDIPYFASFDGQPSAMIKAESAKKIMTIEYTAVHSSYGERRTGVRFAEVMNGLALYAFNQLAFDVTTGTPRRLSGLSKVTEGYGYRKLGEGVKRQDGTWMFFLASREKFASTLNQRIRTSSALCGNEESTIQISNTSAAPPSEIIARRRAKEPR